MDRIIIPQNYKNVLPYIHLTSGMVEDIIQHQQVSFNPTKNDYVEYQLNLPTFVRPFYSYVYHNQSIPTQEEYYNYYVQRNRQYFNENSFTDEIRNAIKARLFRAMPSFVRDLHFNKYVAEHVSGLTALYSLDLDVNEGIDLLLYNEKKIYGINLYTSTTRAYQGRKNKEHRHKLFSNVQYIEFPVDFKSCQRCGGYFLYGENEYNNLINTIQK